MCFSATASFTAAAITGGLGLVTLSRVTRPAEIPLGAMPLIFALQQVIEGSLWLTLDAGTPTGLTDALTLGFLFLAEVWWPVFVPIAVLLIEPEPRRRRAMLVALALGLGTGLFFLWSIVTREHHAMILDEHLVYATERPFPLLFGAVYFGATALPLLLSSRRTVALLGAVIAIGAIVAYFSYWEAFVSVWCFFAAAASGVILFHFERQRRQEGGVSA